jgi:hypothetical protein
MSFLPCSSCFSLLLRMEFQYQLLNTVRANVLKLCMTVKIQLGCDTVKSAINVRNFPLCNLTTVVPVSTESYPTKKLSDF